jgi:hypothetical protein
MPDLKHRAAELADLKDIWGLLRQTANDIPFDLESEADQENVLTEIMACCTSGLSPIVLDENKAIVGALLVRRDDFDWGLGTVTQFMYPMPRSHQPIAIKVFWLQCLRKSSDAKFRCLPA